MTRRSWRHATSPGRKGRARKRGPWGEAEVVLQGMAILAGRRPAEFSIVRTAAPSGCLFRCRDHQGAGNREEEWISSQGPTKLGSS